MQVYKVPQDNWDMLLKRIEKLTRRAKKLGRLTPSLIKVGEHDEVVDAKRGLTRVYYDVVIESEPVAVAGWDFVATIELGDAEVGLIINRVPGVLNGMDIPAEYRKTTNYCSHCQKSVRRNNVYVIRHRESGEWKQIGRNCLGVFLGGVDPKDVVQQMELLISFDSLVSGAQGSDYFGLGGQSDYLDLQSTLVFTAFVTRQLGWLSRSKARELSESGRSVRATADVIADAYFTPEPYKSEAAKDVIKAFDALSDEDKIVFETQAEAAIEWARSLNDEDCNDYLHNIRICCATSSFNRKHMGIVCSVLIAHENAMGRLERIRQEKEQAATLTHVGTVGKRESFELRVIDVKYWQNSFGCTSAVFFNDANANIVVWKASRDPELEIGVTYQLTAKVKAHSEYRNRPQTEISHAKVAGAIGKA